MAATESSYGAPASPFPNAAHMRSTAQRMADGERRREEVPLEAHATWAPAENRPDPVDLLQAGDANRLPGLLPIRYGRMSASPFAFLRGSAVVMASDLSTVPTTSIQTQLCGDAHLANFGAYATPERNLVFDVNDFDETLPGPFEWDVKRLAASAYVAARGNGCREPQSAAAALAAAQSYRTHITAYAEMGYLTTWYSRLDADLVLEAMPTAAHHPIAHEFEKARHHDSIEALHKLTGVVNGRLQIIDAPPLIEHDADQDQVSHFLRTLVREYLASLPEDRRTLLVRYGYVDFARKVVGVGSVGTRCYIVLMMGADHDDPIIFQIKEAGASALEQYLPRSRYAQHGRRIVRGQQLMQAASDMFLGWGHVSPTHFYVRQLRDMKASIDPAKLTSHELRRYSTLCGWALARAHARAGDPALIAGYLGQDDTFDQAMAAFAAAYADQNDRDYAVLLDAIAAGRVQAENDVAR